MPKKGKNPPPKVGTPAFGARARERREKIRKSQADLRVTTAFGRAKAHRDRVNKELGDN